MFAQPERCAQSYTSHEQLVARRRGLETTNSFMALWYYSHILEWQIPWWNKLMRVSIAERTSEISLSTFIRPDTFLDNVSSIALEGYGLTGNLRFRYR